MIHKNAFSKITGKILRRQAGLHDYQIMHPTRDWLIGLCFAVTVFLVGAALSAQLYFSNINTTLVMDDSAEEVVVYRESIVEAALKELEERDAVYQQLQVSSGRVSVPVPASSPAVATTSPVQVGEEISTTTPLIPAGAPVPAESLEQTDDTIVPAPL